MITLKTMSLIAIVALSQVPLPASAGDHIPADTVISLERTTCFGTCPAYTIEVTANGVVNYEGKMYVGVKGKQTAKVGPETVVNLLREFNALGFISLAPGVETECKAWATDNPMVIVTLQTNGRSRTVKNDHGCHGNPVLDSIKKLEDQIDTALDSKRWIKPR